MPRSAVLSAKQINEAKRRRDAGDSLRSIAGSFGVSPSTISRALGRTRKAEEFPKTAPTFHAPRRTQGMGSWTLETIRGARDDQMRGHFARPVALAKALRTDDALFTAYRNRVAPQGSIAACLVPHDSTRGAVVQRKAQDSVIIPRAVLKGIQGTLANHAIAIGHIKQAPKEDGTRVDFRVSEWPLEHVYWDESRKQLLTRVDGGAGPVAITHGDGTWVVFRLCDSEPWAQDACLLPAAMIWAAHAGGISDWAGATASHGRPKIVGELPEGVALQDDAAGTLSAEARAFLDMLTDMAAGDAGAGIRPHGSAIELLFNGSSAWQVFKELTSDRSKAAARVYTGTDAELGSVGGAPGVDIAALFGVKTTIVQGDFEAIEQALNTGVYQPWTAINEGDSRYAPSLRYQMPDPDAQAQSDAKASARSRLMAAIKEMREQQIEVTQEDVDRLAADFGVSPPPRLASKDTAATPLTLAPTDIARVVRVDEARRSQGLAPLGPPVGELFVSELEAYAEAKGAAAEEQATTPPGTPAPPPVEAPAPIVDAPEVPA
jgi:hypothetical protein